VPQIELDIFANDLRDKQEIQTKKDKNFTAVDIGIKAKKENVEVQSPAKAS
jgi:hypothetical protein